MNTPNNAAALDRLEQKWRESAETERDYYSDALVACANELATLRATLAQPDALLPREGMTNIVIGATRHYGGEAWFRELTVAGVTFLAPLDEQEKARGILSALTSQPSGEADGWPEYLMLRDTKLHDDMGGLGQRIFTTAGAGYEKRKYIRADLATHPSADAPGVAVDEAMVSRSLAAAGCNPDLPEGNFQSAFTRDRMRAALTAALAPKPEGGSHG